MNIELSSQVTRNLQAGEPATLGFVADKTGRFELELHQAHQTLAALEVHP